MYQNKKHFSEWSNLYRPLCSVAVLCTSLLVVPDVAFATGIQTTSIITQQQQIVVKGKVVDASGETIIGATILQVGSQSNGAITDIDGNFTIKVPAGTTLEISYLPKNLYLHFQDYLVHMPQNLSNYWHIHFSFQSISFKERIIFSISGNHLFHPEIEDDTKSIR